MVASHVGRIVSDIIKCEQCHSPIAVGRIDAGALHILCRRCGHKTWVVPEVKRSDIVATNRK
jgi:uncharacterized paraquat-inducible protein A